MTQNGIHGRRVVAQTKRKEWMSDNPDVKLSMRFDQVGILTYGQEEGH